MFILYRFLINLIFILSPIIILIRIINKKEDPKRFIEKIGFFSKKKKLGKLIWFHGASVGELQSIMPLIEKFEKNKEVNQILVTSNTLSSSTIIKRFKFKKVVHQFFPIDTNMLVNRFIKFWKPSKVIFIDSEIWPNTLHNLNKRNIPVILLNARITKKTFKRWMIFKIFAKKIFSYYSICYPANQETKKYLEILNVNKIKFLGNLKYAQSNKERELAEKKFKKKFKLDRNVWCAASTHNNEEIVCGKTHLKIKNKIKNLLTIVIPRHIDRCDQIKEDLEKLGLRIVITKDFKKPSFNTDVILVKSYGKTKLFFENSPIVFLGGSLINHGGQNPLESARSGCSIIHGPNVQNFREIYGFLNKLKISHKVINENKLALKLIELFKKKNISNAKHLKLKAVGDKILTEHYNNIILN